MKTFNVEIEISKNSLKDCLDWAQGVLASDEIPEDAQSIEFSADIGNKYSFASMYPTPVQYLAKIKYMRREYK